MTLIQELVPRVTLAEILIGAHPDRDSQIERLAFVAQISEISRVPILISGSSTHKNWGGGGGAGLN